MRSSSAPSNARCNRLPVRVADVPGSEGWISDELSLTRHGPVEFTESVEAFVAELEPDGVTSEEQLESLVVDLPPTMRRPKHRTGRR